MFIGNALVENSIVKLENVTFFQSVDYEEVLTKSQLNPMVRTSFQWRDLSLKLAVKDRQTMLFIILYNVIFSKYLGQHLWLFNTCILNNVVMELSCAASFCQKYVYNVTMLYTLLVTAITVFFIMCFFVRQKVTCKFKVLPVLFLFTIKDVYRKPCLCGINLIVKKLANIFSRQSYASFWVWVLSSYVFEHKYM